jgi:hypothetical protein
MKQTYILLFTLFVSTISFAQSASSYAVLVEAKAIQNPVSVLLTWNLDANASTYTVYRRLPHEPTFGTAVATLSGTDTSYTDTNVELNKEYEYQVKKPPMVIVALDIVMLGLRCLWRMIKVLLCS